MPAGLSCRRVRPCPEESTSHQASVRWGGRLPSKHCERPSSQGGSRHGWMTPEAWKAPGGCKVQYELGTPHGEPVVLLQPTGLRRTVAFSRPLALLGPSSRPEAAIRKKVKPTLPPTRGLLGFFGTGGFPNLNKTSISQLTADCNALQSPFCSHTSD